MTETKQNTCSRPRSEYCQLSSDQNRPWITCGPFSSEPPGPPARDMQTMRSERSRYKHSCPWRISPPAEGPGVVFLLSGRCFVASEFQERENIWKYGTWKQKTQHYRFTYLKWFNNLIYISSMEAIGHLRVLLDSSDIHLRGPCPCIANGSWS